MRDTWKYGLALVLALTLPASVRAQCSFANVAVTPFGPVFEEFPSAFVTGGETWIGYELQNENPTTCPAISVAAGAFVRSAPGRPSPACIVADPLPGTYTFQLASKSGVLFLSHFKTLEPNETCGSDYFGATPAFEYTLRTNFQFDGPGFQLNFDEPISVRDIWGNVCAPPSPATPTPTVTPTAMRTPNACETSATGFCVECGATGGCGGHAGCCWSVAK